MPRPFKAKPKPIGYTFGRPTLYRPEYCDKVTAYMAKGYDLSAFAGEIDVGRETVYDWYHRFEDFRHAVERAKAKRLAFLQTKLLTTSQGVGVTAAIFALKNADPETWQDRYNTTSEVNVKVERIPDNELMRIASTARAPLVIEHEPAPARLGTDAGTKRK